MRLHLKIPRAALLFLLARCFPITRRDREGARVIGFFSFSSLLFIIVLAYAPYFLPSFLSPVSSVFIVLHLAVVSDCRERAFTARPRAAASLLRPSTFAQLYADLLSGARTIFQYLNRRAVREVRNILAVGERELHTAYESSVTGERPQKSAAPQKKIIAKIVPLARFPVSFAVIL